MKKYISMILTSIKGNFQYRFNEITNIVASIIMILLNIFMWLAVYKYSNSTEIAGYTRKTIIEYILITNILTMAFGFDMLTRMASLIKIGKLSLILIRPVSLIKENLAIYIAKKIYVIMIFIIFVIILGFYGKIKYFPVILLLFLLNQLLYFYITSFFGVFGFWMLETWPLHGALNGIYSILSGVFYPLDILPEPVFNVMRYNPFAICTYGLAKALQSKLDFKTLVIYILITIAWIVIFRTLYVILLKKGLKTYEGTGA